MYYSLTNVITGGTYYCKRSEYFRKGTAPHRTYTGISYSQDKGFEIIGIHNTEAEAVRNLLKNS